MDLVDDRNTVARSQSPMLCLEFDTAIESELQKFMDRTPTAVRVELIISNASPVSPHRPHHAPPGNFAARSDIAAFSICHIDRVKGRRPTVIGLSIASEEVAGVMRSSEGFYECNQRATDQENERFLGSYWARIGQHHRDRFGKLVIWYADWDGLDEADAAARSGTVARKVSEVTYDHLDEISSKASREMGRLLKSNGRNDIWHNALNAGCEFIKKTLDGVEEVLFFGKVAGTQNELGLVAAATSKTRSYIRGCREGGRVPRLVGIGHLAVRSRQCIRTRRHGLDRVTGYAEINHPGWRPALLKRGQTTYWNDEDYAVLAAPVYSPYAPKPFTRLVGVFVVGRAADEHFDGFWGCDELYLRDAIHALMTWVFDRKRASDHERVLPYVGTLLELPKRKQNQFRGRFDDPICPETELLLRHAESLRDQVRQLPAFKSVRHFVQSEVKQSRIPVYGDDFTSDSR